MVRTRAWEEGTTVAIEDADANDQSGVHDKFRPPHLLRAGRLQPSRSKGGQSPHFDGDLPRLVLLQAVKSN
jgi:hypothetical protein